MAMKHAPDPDPHGRRAPLPAAQRQRQHAGDEREGGHQDRAETIAVGLEDVADLCADLARGLA